MKHDPGLLEKETNELRELMKLTGLEFKLMGSRPFSPPLPRFKIRKDTVIDFIKNSTLGKYIIKKDLES